MKIVQLSPAMPPANSFHNTRIAPTPSGYLHLGNAASFLLTASLAAQYGARVLLRIDDMDRARFRPEYLQDVFDTLQFLGIAWQEGPADATDFEAHWSQRHRLPLYNGLLQQLAEQRLVYACTCSRTDMLRLRPDGLYTGTCRNKGLPLETPGAAWRIRTDHQVRLTVELRNAEAITTYLPQSQHDFIVRKKDGAPAYQLSSLADDVHFGIDFIVRGADLWDSTLAQLYLAQCLDLAAFQKTVFLHHPLVPDADGNKLSKSAGATSVHYLRQTNAPALQEELRSITARFLSEV